MLLALSCWILFPTILVSLFWQFLTPENLSIHIHNFQNIVIYISVGSHSHLQFHKHLHKKQISLKRELNTS